MNEDGQDTNSSISPTRSLDLRSIEWDSIEDAVQQYLLDPTQSIEETLVERGLITPQQKLMLDAQQSVGSRAGDSASAFLAVYRALLTLSDEDVTLVPNNDEHVSGQRQLPTGDGEAITRDSTEFTVSPNRHQSTESDAGRFVWLRAHAEGGLGKVSVALDTELQREVALKQIKDKYCDSLRGRLRFLREAEITGSLEHPGIVPVYGLGADPEGRPYYAMRFIRGESLKEAIEGFHGRVMSAGERRTDLMRLLRRFVDVCNTIEYAHSRKILHRDLKPGNVMLGPYGETLVVDWGLAKRIGVPDKPPSPMRPEENSPVAVADRMEAKSRSEAKSNGERSSDHVLTIEGQVVGTPGFMSPEQASGFVDALGPATDIYSLGAILYTILTGKTPFENATKRDILAKILKGDFARPRALNAEIPAALEAICLQAMQTSPDSRYRSAQALASDIESWMADEPISVHREALSEKALRLARRYRSWTVVSFLALTVLTIGSVVSVLLISNSKFEADRQARIATSLRLARESEATRSSTPVRSSLLALASIGMQTEARESILPQSRAAVYNSLLALEGQPILRLAEFPRRIVPTPDGSVITLDASYQLEKWTKAANGAEALWSIEKGPEDEAAIDPTGKFYAVGCQTGEVKLYDLSVVPPKEQVVQAHPAFVDFVGFDALSRWLVTCSMDQAILWDVSAGQLKRHCEIALQQQPMRSRFVISPSNHFMLIGSHSGCEYFDLTKSPPERLSVPNDEGPMSLLVTDPTGRWLVTSRNRSQLCLWDLDASKPEPKVMEFDGMNRDPMEATFSADSTKLAIGFRNGGIQIVYPQEADLKKTTVALPPHADRILALAFDQQAERLATASRDGVTRLWRITPSNPWPYREMRGHDGIVYSLAFDQKGDLMTGGADRTVRAIVSTEADHNPAYRRLQYGNYPWDLQFDPTGMLMVSGGEDYVLFRNLIHGDTQKTVRSVSVGPRKATAISDDGRWLVTCQAGHHKCFDLAASNPSEVVSEWDSMDWDVAANLAFSSDGRYFVSAGPKTFVWRFQEGRVVGEPQVIDIHGFAAQFSPDGNWLAIAPPSGLHLFQFKDGVAVQPTILSEEVDMVQSIAFSFDHRQMAWGGADGVILVTELSTEGLGKIREMRGHLRGLAGVAFSRDGKWLASAGSDQAIRLWDLSMGAKTSDMVLRSNWGAALKVCFDYQSQWLAASFEDGSVRCWNLDLKTVIDELQKRIGREFTDDERREFVLPDGISK